MTQNLRSNRARSIATAFVRTWLSALVLMTGCNAGESFPTEAFETTDSTSLSETHPVAALVQAEAAVADAHLEKQISDRKIVYTADMQLEVIEFEAAVDSLKSMIDRFAGFVASHEIEGDAGLRRLGRWKIRIPSDNFEGFHSELKGLGYPIRDALQSTEVTEEYVDVERRIANLKRMEARLQAHLEKSTKDLKDIFEVEQELTRVGAETERLQGKLQLLQDLTALATINLEIAEKKVYEPLALEEPPAFTVQVHDTFEESSNALLDVGQQTALVLVRLAPWLPLLIVGGILLRAIVRHQRRRVSARI